MASLPAPAPAVAPASSQAPSPSLKALGKRRLDSPVDSLAPSSLNSTKAPQPPQVQATKAREKRVTRSSLGGQQAGSREQSVGTSEGAAPPLYLPLKTTILLTTRALAGVSHYPPADPWSIAGPVPAAVRPSPNLPQGDLPGSEIVAEETNPEVTGQKTEEKPLFRLLDDSELLPPRGSRHAPLPDSDTSDAFYLRLHRYPEVLEKRASRLERERLIHERSKLILELEELRGRGWVYMGNNAGGRAEEERQRKIREGEERLKRYDALLPNQPRKSNFLNLASGSASATAPPPSLSQPAAPSRTVSPIPAAPSGTRSRPVRAPVPSRPSSSFASSDLHRPPTPLSATGDGGTTIRIRFGAGPGSASASLAPSPVSSPAPPMHDYTTLNPYGAQPSPRKGPRRDRKAERERAEERRRLGIAPRASIEKAKYGTKARRGPQRRRSVNYAQDEDEDEDEELEFGDDDEDGEGPGDEHDEWDDTDSETGLPYRASRTVRSGTSASHPARSSSIRSKRLPGSFFHSAALRDSVLLSHQPGRRSSSRVAYAFGHRLPDAALLKYQEFEPHGGVDGEGAGRTLEEMVRERREHKGESVVVLGGRVLPKSAVDAWTVDPMAARSPAKPTATEERAGAGAAMQIDPPPPPSPPQPLPTATNGHHPHRQEGPTTSPPPSPPSRHRRRSPSPTQQQQVPLSPALPPPLPSAASQPPPPPTPQAREITPRPVPSPALASAAPVAPPPLAFARPAVTQVLFASGSGPSEVQVQVRAGKMDVDP
ncbi:SPOSA6832_04855 [Sporobolomyces salmonicolor]|uniref:SPOSA6832_04855-mRNA-1:cds n=1 Tax=Sporidiobolus salmonicolor TaxID=5005 RepID=A0A0D6ES64_SPOSA|nr:SPOSA6832_04855 [Sporobolomyces salmonicolor]